MNKNNDDYINEPDDEEELELKRYIRKGKNLKWTWIIGTPLIIICIMYGDAAQWLLAFFIMVYIYISTANYFK
jgi:hypothetical protein